jgi:hypothetical protein
VTERLREVRRLAIADEAGYVAYGDSRLLGQKLRPRSHPPVEEILLEALLSELCICALYLSRRARQRSRDHRERKPAAVVTRHDHAREQIQPAARPAGVGVHTHFSDPLAQRGTPRGASRAAVQPA